MELKTGEGKCWQGPQIRRSGVQVLEAKIEKLKAAISSPPEKPKDLLEVEELHRTLCDELVPLQKEREQQGLAHMQRGAVHADAKMEALRRKIELKESEIYAAFEKRRALLERHVPGVLKTMTSGTAEGEALFLELFGMIGKLAAVYEEAGRQAGRNGVSVTERARLWQRAPQLAQIARQGQLLI